MVCCTVIDGLFGANTWSVEGKQMIYFAYTDGLFWEVNKISLQY